MGEELKLTNEEIKELTAKTATLEQMLETVRTTSDEQLTHVREENARILKLLFGSDDPPMFEDVTIAKMVEMAGKGADAIGTPIEQKALARNMVKIIGDRNATIKNLLAEVDDLAERLERVEP